MQAERGSLFFRVLGRSFSTAGASPALAEWLRESWDFPQLIVPPHPYAIALDSVATASTGPRDGWTGVDVPIPGRTLRFRNAGPWWESGDADQGLRLEVGRDESRIELWGLDGDRDPSELYHGLYVALSEALRASGLVPLHAAVAARGEEAVAWLGASGLGKSTTLLFAVESGWRPIAEDLGWIEPATLRLYGWDRGVRCWPETLRRFFPRLRGGEATADGKRLISYEQLRATEPRCGTLTRLAVLERDAAGPSRSEPASARDLVKALWEATGVPLSAQSRDAAKACIERLSRLPVSRLVLGNTSPPPIEADGPPPGQAGGG
jgi:hypothetical protein